MLAAQHLEGESCVAGRGYLGPKADFFAIRKAWIAPCKSAQAPVLVAAVSDGVA